MTGRGSGSKLDSNLTLLPDQQGLKVLSIQKSQNNLCGV